MRQYKKYIYPFIRFLGVGICLILGIGFMCGCEFGGDITERFSGQWYDEKNDISVDITKESEDTFLVFITSEKEEDEMYIWEMECRLQDKTITYKNGKKSVVSYDSYGNALEEAEYESGTGSFSIRFGKLIWNDEVEDVAKGLRFQKSETLK